MKDLTSYIVPLIVVAFIVRRLLRNRARKVRTNRIFWLPVIVIVALVITLWGRPLPSPWPLWVVLDAVALIGGLVAGFLSAHHQEFSLDYETGTITSRATPIGMILVGLLFAASFAMKFLLPQINGSPFSAASYLPTSPLPSIPAHLSGALLGWTDAGLIFSTALLFARAATTWLRAQPLIEAHKTHVADNPGIKTKKKRK